MSALKKIMVLCLGLLLLSVYSAFAEKGARFDLGIDSFLFIKEFIDGPPERYDDTDASVFDFLYKSPDWPLIGADLYYQTSGERFRIGFGAKIYSIILFSAVIPSIYAEFNTRRFAAAIQAGAIPIMFSMVVPIGASMEFSMLSVSGWFKITERFRVGAIGYYDFKMPALIPLFVVSARWTLAGADDAGS